MKPFCKPAHHTLVSSSHRIDWHRSSVRRELLSGAAASAVLACLDVPAVCARDKYEPMGALKGKDYGKTRTRYPDYVLTNSGACLFRLRLGCEDC